ncbi:metal dependent phosphohydrolase [Bacillus methanolicus PB1]|uniref:Metal dependent phosphohydrolase n=1 Tax=Bacillus methanolicus PB1 TaxID=997296 RepID=I3DWF4_BACMT|nr:HD domain-containing protein [Bacillus methanolicus]EIJ78575.1 metal dependent phosphohydrolase [Bacillus methanolicus PB1]
MKEEIMKRTEAFVKQMMGRDSTGHDWHHVDRVRRNALNISKKEQSGDPFIIEMAALLHDIPDDKLNNSHEEGRHKLAGFMDVLDLPPAVKKHITEIIFSISFKGGKGPKLSSAEAKIVQDADRLDAIGAIGIARAFAFGGKKGQPIFDPSLSVRDNMTVEEYRNGESSSIHHFYEKLLQIKDSLHTATAKEMAKERHQFMEAFLTQFYSEWNGQA